MLLKVMRFTSQMLKVCNNNLTSSWKLQSCYFSSIKSTSLCIIPMDHYSIPIAGLKRHVGVHRRCKDCKVTRITGRLAIVCSSKPRHNQLQWGRGHQKRLHKPYPWRWPDPFDKKYGNTTPFYEDRYPEAFK